MGEENKGDRVILLDVSETKLYISAISRWDLILGTSTAGWHGRAEVQQRDYRPKSKMRTKSAMKMKKTLPILIFLQLWALYVAFEVRPNLKYSCTIIQKFRNTSVSSFRFQNDRRNVRASYLPCHLYGYRFSFIILPNNDDFKILGEITCLRSRGKQRGGIWVSEAALSTRHSSSCASSKRGLYHKNWILW